MRHLRLSCGESNKGREKEEEKKKTMRKAG